MIAFIIKSTLCLSTFYTLYLLFLRKEKRFQFTRFYLLLTLTFSLAFPFMDFTKWVEEPIIDTSHLDIIPTREIFIDMEAFVASPITEVREEKKFSVWQGLVTVLILGSIIMLLRFLKNLWDLSQLINRSKRLDFAGARIVLLNKSIVPFSFGKHVFISSADYENDQIDQDILRHEMSHVRQWHTLDVVLMELVLVVYWFNPILWFWRQAIKTNHEYLADQSVVKEESQIYSYSKKIIDYLDNSTSVLLASSFNYSLTKNRLMMMTRSKTSKWQFVKKLSMLSGIAIASLALLAFNDLNYSREDIQLSEMASIVQDLKPEIASKPVLKEIPKIQVVKKTKPQAEEVNKASLPVISEIPAKDAPTKTRSITYAATIPSNQFVVVLDPGHGGEDSGTSNEEHLEKDISLDIAKAVKTLNNDSDIKIILTRNTDKTTTLFDRIEMVKKEQAEMLLSIHINSAPYSSKKNGVEIYVSTKNENTYQNKAMCRALLQNLRMHDKGPEGVKEANFFVLRNASCPAVMVNIGFLTNKRDANFLSESANRKEMAKQILASIQEYKRSYNR